MNRVIGLFIIAAFVLSISMPSQAGAEKKAGAAPGKQNDAPAAMQEQMAKAQKLATPGEKHKVLENMIGNWKTTNKFWMSPESKPEESHGTCENHWILNNHFVQQSFKGEAMGQPFEGMGILGYDNVRGQYTSVWMDNMSTGMMNGTAQFNSKTKAMSEKGTFSCPMTMEKSRTYRSVWKIVDNDHSTYEMYMKDPNGKEFKAMEISYVRVK